MQTSWTIGIALGVLILGGYGYHRIVLGSQTARYSAKQRTRERPSIAEVSAAPIRNDIDAWFGSHRRQMGIWALERDIQNAKELMRLEQEASELRREYASRERQTPQGRHVMDEITHSIEQLKRGRVA